MESHGFYSNWRSSRRNSIKFIFVAVVTGLAIKRYVFDGNPLHTRGPNAGKRGDGQFRDAYDSRAQDLHIWRGGAGGGILKDDLDGSRHQRFILRLPSEQQLLIAHNIDIAPRVDNLREGDYVLSTANTSGITTAV